VKEPKIKVTLLIVVSVCLLQNVARIACRLWWC